MTVRITIGGLLKGELYITRREIYRYYLALHPDGRWIGRVEDLSEQFVIGASMAHPAAGIEQPPDSRSGPEPRHPGARAGIGLDLEGPRAAAGRPLPARAGLRRGRRQARPREPPMTGLPPRTRVL